MSSQSVPFNYTRHTHTSTLEEYTQRGKKQYKTKQFGGFNFQITLGG